MVSLLPSPDCQKKPTSLLKGTLVRGEQVRHIEAIVSYVVGTVNSWQLLGLYPSVLDEECLGVVKSVLGNTSLLEAQPAFLILRRREFGDKAFSPGLSLGSPALCAWLKGEGG